MNKLMIATAITASVLFSGVAHAGDLPDYSDKTLTCDKDKIEKETAAIIQHSPAGTAYGVRLIYVKGEPVETSRKSDELRCRISVVTTRGTENGVFPLFQPGRPQACRLAAR